MKNCRNILIVLMFVGCSTSVFSQKSTEVSRFFMSSIELIDTVIEVYENTYNSYIEYVDIFQMYDTVFFVSREYYLDTTILIANSYSEQEGYFKQYICLKYDPDLYERYEKLKNIQSTKSQKRDFYNVFFYRIHVYEHDNLRKNVQKGDVVIMLNHHFISKYQALTFCFNEEGEIILKHIYPNY